MLIQCVYIYYINPGTISSSTKYIPLRFWFNRNTGLALPLIALQYHDVKINIEYILKKLEYHILIY